AAAELLAVAQRARTFDALAVDEGAVLAAGVGDRDLAARVDFDARVLARQALVGHADVTLATATDALAANAQLVHALVALPGVDDQARHRGPDCRPAIASLASACNRTIAAVDRPAPCPRPALRLPPIRPSIWSHPWPAS